MRNDVRLRFHLRRGFYRGNGRIPHWTLNDAEILIKYIRSITAEEDAKRLALLHEKVCDIMGDSAILDDSDTRKRVDRDIRG